MRARIVFSNPVRVFLAGDSLLRCLPFGPFCTFETIKGFVVVKYQASSCQPDGIVFGLRYARHQSARTQDQNRGLYDRSGSQVDSPDVAQG